MVTGGSMPPEPRHLESRRVRVLLTNDDGIAAPGLQAARRALRELDGVEVDVIAPDSNRSATARSITTRSPLTRRGGRVRRRRRRLRDRRHAGRLRPLRRAGPGRRPARPDRLRDQPRRQPRRRHHLLGHGRRGASRGSSSGSPRSPLSQQSSGGGMGYVSGRFDFGVAAAFAAAAGRAACAHEPMPEATLINVNCPGRRADRDRGDEARQTDLQRRAEAGRRGRGRAAAATRSTAGSPATRRSRAPTSTRSPRGGSRSPRSTSTSPTTAASSALRGWGFEEMLAASAPAA